MKTAIHPASDVASLGYGHLHTALPRTVGGGGRVAQEASTGSSQSQHVTSRQPSPDIFLYREVQKFWEVLQIIILSVEETIRVSKGLGAEARSPSTYNCVETGMKPNVSKIYGFSQSVIFLIFGIT